MSWHRHDAGLFSLDLPPGWIVEQPTTGTLLLQDPRSHVALSLLAASHASHIGYTSAAPNLPMEVQAELRKWVDCQKHVAIGQAPRLLPGARYPTATAEGLQHIAPSRWPQSLIRLLPRWLPGARALVTWRFWALLNPRLLILASCSGKPAAMEAQRPLLDRLIGSLELPRYDILFGRTFTETVVSLARSWFPETYASVIDDAHVQFGTQHLSIAGLHRHYLAHPEELPTQVRAFFSAAQGNLPAVALDWSLARPRVLPLLVSNRLLEHDVTSVAPSHTGEDVILEEWVNGLSIAFTLEQSARRAAPAGETPAPERMITREDLAHWNVTAEELRAQALQNLVHHSREHVMEGRKSDGFTMLCLSNSDRHNATRILLPELHLKLRDHLGPTFLAAIPSREVLIAFNISDEDVLFRMRQDVAHDFRHSSRPLSPKLFLVTPDGIAGDPEEAEDFHI